MNYSKYRWFFTSRGILVYGGKSAEQNEEVVKGIMDKKELVVMHTRMPGSPFAVIDSSMNKLEKQDIEESLVFTACFSRAWRENKKETDIDIFSNKQIFKLKGMKEGTFGVKGEVDRKKAKLELCLVVQKGKIRAVPLLTAKNMKVHEKLIILTPGKIEKEKAAELIGKKLKIDKEEILNALPTGGSEILLNRKI